jgi:hypothetical protein
VGTSVPEEARLSVTALRALPAAAVQLPRDLVVKIGIKRSPHLEAVVLGIQARKHRLVDTADTGCDAYLCWGWPQAREVQEQEMAPWCKAPLICVDAHPFALKTNATSGSRIMSINGWGAKADYAKVRDVEWTDPPVSPHYDPDGPVLVLGQVGTEQKSRRGEIDVWVTDGYEQWVEKELQKPNRKFREHPRSWMHRIGRDGVHQPTLEEDLKGCSGVIGWNSTAMVHAQLLGYPVIEAVEEHAYVRRFSLKDLAELECTLPDLRSGIAWKAIERYIHEHRKSS